jgi:class 3 adenylate cyclase
VADHVLATISTRVTRRGDEPVDIDGFVAHARREIEWFRGRWLERAGDGLTGAFDGPARAIRCAVSLTAAASRYGLSARCGLHTGECADDGGRLQGPAVALAATLSELAPAGEVFVSRTVKDLVAGAGLFFDRRGAHALDVDGQTWRVFAARARAVPGRRSDRGRPPAGR